MPVQRRIIIPPLLMEYVDSWCRRDLDRYLRTYAADATYEDPATSKPLSGEGLRPYFEALFAGFPDAKFETVSLHANGENYGFWEWVMQATNTGPFGGAPPTNQKVTVPGCEFIRFTNGKVKRVHGYFDQLNFLIQLGLYTPPG